jgi:predicted nucleic acid-binding protein
VLLAYLALIEIVITDKLEPVVVRDQDDDEVMACAIQADVDCVITGDQHLLSIGEYLNINIITAAEAIDVLQA